MHTSPRMRTLALQKPSCSLRFLMHIFLTVWKNLPEKEKSVLNTKKSPIIHKIRVMSSAVGADSLPSDPACLDQRVLTAASCQPTALLQESSIAQKPAWATDVQFVHAPNILSSNEATVKDSQFHLSSPLSYLLVFIWGLQKVSRNILF